MRKIFFSLVMALALVSCSTDELSNGGTPASDKGSVQLVLSTDGFDMVSRAVDESAIHDVNILEYKDGALVQQVYLTQSNATNFSESVQVYGLTDIPATLMEDATDAEGNKVQVMKENGIENFIFIVANCGEVNRTEVPTLAKLKELTMSFTGKKTMTNLPMTGFYYGGINGTSTTTMNVTLQRAVAKIDFTLDTSQFKIGGKVPEQFSVNSIKLCNVPGNITLYPCKVRPSLPKSDTEAGKWNFGSQTPFPTASEMASSVTYGDDENQSSTANTYVAYIPENARGSYSNITDNEDKHPSKCDSKITDEKADKTYTYILVDLLYVMSNGTAGNATYRIYLGGNKTGDMNLLRNTEYNVTTSLKDANTADTRISVNDVSDTYLAAANCYMIDMSSGAKNIIIPLSQVNKGWAKIAEYDESQTTTASNVKSMLESGNWEIQTEWRTWKKGSSITGTKSSDFSASNLKATLTIPADVENGNNAVVKLVSKADGKTYWSWHLWFTDYKPSATDGTAKNGQVHKYFGAAFQTGGIYANKYIMDRNLGATITGVSGAISQPSTNAVKYYGLMYQWGRKDPFVGSLDGSNNTSSSYNDFVAIYDATGTRIKNSDDTLPFEIASGSKSSSYLANVINSPSTFYTSTAVGGKWTNEDDLWDATGKNKSVFDPCPPGWRVPLGGITAANNPWYGFNINDNFLWKGSRVDPLGGRLYDYDGVQAWYPASGLLMYTDGTLQSVGSGGYSWSTTFPNNSASYNLSFYFTYMDSSYGGGNRSYGCPVRCIQE